jgi:hypothetical protein
VRSAFGLTRIESCIDFERWGLGRAMSLRTRGYGKRAGVETKIAGCTRSFAHCNQGLISTRTAAHCVTRPHTPCVLAILLTQHRDHHPTRLAEHLRPTTSTSGDADSSTFPEGGNQMGQSKLQCNSATTPSTMPTLQDESLPPVIWKYGEMEIINDCRHSVCLQSACSLAHLDNVLTGDRWSR